LTGVWAEENTRSAIYAALKRRETFGTSGTRIKIRLSGGFDKRSPQGREIAARNGQLTFHAWAIADPEAAKLQRLQIIKGWVENGEPKERVFDIACAGEQSVDADTHRCPENDAWVDTSTCAHAQSSGAAELATTWTDPAYAPDQYAFYYLRALENPTCRWSTWAAVRAGTRPRPDLPLTIQERAWSSPIWVSPPD
jgi:hypothetical protein